MSDNLLDGVMDDCDMLGAPRPGEGMYETATGGFVYDDDDDDEVETVGGDFDGNNDSGRVLFGTEGTGSSYQVVMVYPDLCLGFLTGNQSFCRKNKQKCHSVHAGNGNFTLGEDSLALAKSSGSAFFDPVIPGETLKGDLQSALLSKKMTVSDWSRMCSQVKALEPPVSCNDLAGEQAYSQKTKDYLQTPRKLKSEPTEFDFRQEDDEDDEEDDPFEQVDTFVKSDPLGGLSEDKRLDFVEDYLSKSSEEAVKLRLRELPQGNARFFQYSQG